MAPQSWAVREFCPGHVSQISGLKIGFVSPSPHPKGGHGVASGGGGGLNTRIVGICVVTCVIGIFASSHIYMCMCIYVNIYI